MARLFTAEPARNGALGLGTAILHLAINLVYLLQGICLRALGVGFGFALGLGKLLLGRRELEVGLATGSSVQGNGVQGWEVVTYSGIYLGPSFLAVLLALFFSIDTAAGQLALDLSSSLVDVA